MLKAEPWMMTMVDERRAGYMEEVAQRVWESTQAVLGRSVVSGSAKIPPRCTESVSRAISRLA
jgi:hypothetical protein